MGKTIENSSVDWREVDSNPRNYALNRMWSGRGQGESQSRFFRASSGLFLMFCLLLFRAIIHCAHIVEEPGKIYSYCRFKSFVENREAVDSVLYRYVFE